MLTKRDIEEQLKRSAGTLAQFGVKTLHLFGSHARGDATVESDLDFLVEFDGPATFDRYMDTKFFLEDLFSRKVDLVTTKALRPELRPSIEREAVRVA
jgi:hypothetical protein